VSGNPTVFRKNEIQEFPNTDIEILIDGSKSMTDENVNGETRIQLAMEASLALALALEGIDGVTPSVTRFPYRSTSDVIQVLKHGERVRSNASAFLPIANGDTTPLHVALWYVASTILNGQGNRKIVFVLFDGKPDDPEATLSVIKRCEAAGIEFVGVGIGLDVSKYFKNNIKINNINDITGELFRISRKLLIAA
jgi:cobalamin biosynthesis protein CobT